MDFLIDLATLVLLWALAIVAIIFAVGAFFTQRSIVKAQRSKTVKPETRFGTVVTFMDGKRERDFIVKTVRHRTDRGVEIILQDTVSYSKQDPH